MDEKKVKYSKEDREKFKERERQIEALREQRMKEEDLNRKKGKTPPTDAYISLRNINKVYDNSVQAVYDFNLDIQKHELIVFVGPSGCGKSTTLRMIAGLEEITTGDLFIDGVYCNEKTAKERDVAMVFQNYALYPHMTVYENMAFGLKIRNFSKEEIDVRVQRAAEILQIGEYLDRRPKELSGGQMQRVALGRAIVREAKVFLMDEPLSNLDAKLRVSMRSEIIKLHKKINATTIYVTHDQTEAMTMASRIVVMKDGYIQQIGVPEEIYNHPANAFVATFIGAPAMNLIPCTYKKGTLYFGDGFEIRLPEEAIEKHDHFYRDQIERIRKDLEDRVYENIDESLILTHQKEKFSLKKAIKREVKPLNIQTAEEKRALLEKQLAFYERCLDGEHEATFGIRPEDVYENTEIPSSVLRSKEIELPVSVSELLGSEYYIHLNYLGKELIAKCKVTKRIEDNEAFEFVFDLNKIHLFDALDTRAIF